MQEKHSCEQFECKGRLTTQYRDGRYLCRSHTVEVMANDLWIDDWLAKNYPAMLVPHGTM